MSLGADLCMLVAALVLAYFLNPWNLMEMSIILANKEKNRNKTSALGRSSRSRLAGLTIVTER